MWIIRKIGRIFNRESGRMPKSPNSAGTELPKLGTAKIAGSQSYSSDEPIQSRADDRFGRWPFARRIATTLATRPASSGIVVGLFGPWGDGKTSALRMVEEELANHPSVIVAKFNPWYFEDEAKLLHGFFQTLADAIGRSLPSLQQRIGGLLAEYGAILSVVSVRVAEVVEIGAGDSVQKLGRSLAAGTLEGTKRRIESLLQESGCTPSARVGQKRRIEEGRVSGSS